MEMLMIYTSILLLILVLAITIFVIKYLGFFEFLILDELFEFIFDFILELFD